MRPVNVGDEADFQRSRTLIPSINIPRMTKMKKLSAMIPEADQVLVDFWTVVDK